MQCHDIAVTVFQSEDVLFYKQDHLELKNQEITEKINLPPILCFRNVFKSSRRVLFQLEINSPEIVNGKLPLSRSSQVEGSGVPYGVWWEVRVMRRKERVEQSESRTD